MSSKAPTERRESAIGRMTRRKRALWHARCELDGHSHGKFILCSSCWQGRLLFSSVVKGPYTSIVLVVGWRAMGDMMVAGEGLAAAGNFWLCINYRPCRSTCKRTVKQFQNSEFGHSLQLYVNRQVHGTCASMHPGKHRLFRSSSQRSVAQRQRRVDPKCISTIMCSMTSKYKAKHVIQTR